MLPLREERRMGWGFEGVMVDGISVWLQLAHPMNLYHVIGRPLGVRGVGLLRASGGGTGPSAVEASGIVGYFKGDSVLSEGVGRLKEFFFGFLGG